MTVTARVEQGVAEVTLDHPPVNAFDSKGWCEIADTITALGSRDDVHCIILAASGKGFCAGVDIKELAGTSLEMANRMRRPLSSRYLAAFLATCRPLFRA